MACKNGYIAIVTELLKHPAGLLSITKQLYDGSTPFFIACQKGHTAIVTLLLEHAAGLLSITKQLPDGTTPLFIACQNGHYKVIAELLKHKSGRNSIANLEINNTLLTIACFYGRDTVVALLLQYATPETINQQNHNPLQVTLINDDSRARGTYTSAALLLAHGANSNALNKDQQIDLLSFTECCIHALSSLTKRYASIRSFSEQILTNTETQNPDKEPTQLAHLASFVNHTDPRKRLTTKQLGILFNDPNFYELYFSTSGFSRSVVLPLQTLALMYSIQLFCAKT